MLRLVRETLDSDVEDGSGLGAADDERALPAPFPAPAPLPAAGAPAPSDADVVADARSVRTLAHRFVPSTTSQFPNSATSSDAKQSTLRSNLPPISSVSTFFQELRTPLIECVSFKSLSCSDPPRRASVSFSQMYRLVS